MCTVLTSCGFAMARTIVNIPPYKKMAECQQSTTSIPTYSTKKNPELSYYTVELCRPCNPTIRTCVALKCAFFFFCGRQQTHSSNDTHLHPMASTCSLHMASTCSLHMASTCSLHMASTCSLHMASTCSLHMASTCSLHMASTCSLHMASTCSLHMASTCSLHNSACTLNAVAQ